MASSEASAIARLTVADLPGCLALSQEAQWNQVESDWRLFFERGLVWGIRLEDRLVASAAVLPYPPRTAWVSMVLTAERARGRGFASRLTATALEHCETQGLVPQLDATPQGEPVYRRLGFHTLACLTRWRHSATQARATSEPVQYDAPTPCDAIGALEESALGFARPEVLSWLQRRGPAQLSDRAFVLSRDGRTARQIGPIVGQSWTACATVLDALEAALTPSEAIVVDAFDEATPLCAWLAERGYRAERPFLRMAKGQQPRHDPARYLASAGPELG